MAGSPDPIRRCHPGPGHRRRRDCRRLRRGRAPDCHRPVEVPRSLHCRPRRPATRCLPTDRRVLDGVVLSFRCSIHTSAERGGAHRGRHGSVRATTPESRRGKLRGACSWHTVILSGGGSAVPFRPTTGRQARRAINAVHPFRAAIARFAQVSSAQDCGELQGVVRNRVFGYDGSATEEERHTWRLRRCGRLSDLLCA